MSACLAAMPVTDALPPATRIGRWLWIGFGSAIRIPKLVVPPDERRPWIVEDRADDDAGFMHPPGAFTSRSEADAERPMLAGAEAKDHPAAAHVIEGRRHLGKHGRMPERHWSDKGPMRIRWMAAAIAPSTCHASNRSAPDSRAIR
jgi:hypothetical protein